MTSQGSILARLPRGVWLIAATSAILMSGVGMIVPMIPVYGRQLGASAVELGLLMAAVFVGRLAAQIPAGLASDRYGRKAVLLIALLGYALTCVGYASARSPVLLIAFRLLQGLSAGSFAVAARSLISDLAGPRVRGTAQGIYSASVNLGFVTGPVLGALAVHHFSMSAPFWAAAVLSGAALVALAGISLPKLPRRSIADRLTLLGALAGFRVARVRLLAGVNLFFLAGLSVIMTLFPVAGSSEIRGGVVFVGTALTVAGASGFVLGPFAGRMSDRLGRPPLMLAGALLAAAEGTALLFTRDPWVIGLGFFAGGIGAASFFNSLHAAVGDLTLRKERGRVTGLVGLAGEGGGIAGSMMAPVVWELTDLRMPFALQLLATILVIGLITWIWSKGPPRPIRPAGIRESIIPG